jgi:hypothetical protein
MFSFGGGSSMYIKYSDPETNLPRLTYANTDNLTIRQIEKGIWSVRDLDNDLNMGMYFDSKTAEEALDLLFRGFMTEASGIDLILFQIFYNDDGGTNNEDIEE